MSFSRSTLGLILMLIAWGLLYPGLTQPVLSLTGVVDKQDIARIGKDIIVADPETPELVATLAEVLVARMNLDGTVQAYYRSRSILGTIEELYRNQHLLVAFLVAFFSIVVPVVKGLMLLVSRFGGNARLGQSLDRVSSLISKWSMADVFVVGLFVAFLAANAVRREGGLLSFEAELGAGFYFFLGYCLLSILATQLLVREQR